MYRCTKYLKSNSKQLCTKYTIQQIQEKTHNLTRSGYRIVFIWVPGHAGVEGNEMENSAAKEGANEEKKVLITNPTSTGMKKKLTVIGLIYRITRQKTLRLDFFFFFVCSFFGTEMNTIR